MRRVGAREYRDQLKSQLESIAWPWRLFGGQLYRRLGLLLGVRLLRQLREPTQEDLCDE